MDAISKKKGLLYVFLSALMFGSYGVWAHLIGDGQGIFYPNWTRALLIAGILLPILLYKKQIVRIERKDWKWFVVFFLATSLTQAPLFYAFNHMDIGSATLLFFVTMLLMMYIVGFAFLGEKWISVKVISFALACIGLYMTFSFSIATFTLTAALMAILNGIASGGEVSFSKKLTNSYSTLYLTWLSWVVIAVTNGIISLVIGEIQYLPGPTLFWLYQCGYAVASIFGFWLVIEGFKYVEASIGGLLGLLEIVFSIGLGILIFHQPVTEKIIIGAVIILCAAAFPHIVELIKKKTVLDYES